MLTEKDINELELHNAEARVKMEQMKKERIEAQLAIQDIDAFVNAVRRAKKEGIIKAGQPTTVTFSFPAPKQKDFVIASDPCKACVYADHRKSKTRTAALMMAMCVAAMVALVVYFRIAFGVTL